MSPSDLAPSASGGYWRRVRGDLNAADFVAVLGVALLASLQVLFQPSLFELWDLVDIGLAWSRYLFEAATIVSALVVAVTLVRQAPVAHAGVRIAWTLAALALPAQLSVWVVYWGYTGSWTPQSWMSMVGEGVRFSLLGAFVVGIRALHRRTLQAGEEARSSQTMRLDLERQAMQAQLQLLQAQIEPHFLFNTLANVRRQYRQHPAAGAQSIDNLMIYLRAALPQLRRATSTLGEEFELVRAYLQLFQVRMGPRLHFTLELPSHLRAAAFPSAVLITLVENAVKHGLAPTGEGGTIRVAAAHRASRLEVTVLDDGVGLGTGPSGTGVGLVNIRRQLMARFGEAAQLTLEQEAGCGVCARISVPWTPSAHQARARGRLSRAAAARA